MDSMIKNKVFDEERALYNLKDCVVESCRFEGPADGESALKEARNVRVKNCAFSLRYPLWHTKGFALENCTMDIYARAAVWYASDGKISDCTLGGIKCLRECDNIVLENCGAVSPEFGWKCRGITFDGCDIESEYFLLDSRDIIIKNLKMRGKYSFQYVENMTVDSSEFDTKDAFWHSKNVTVKNSIIKGEYLGWYSENLTLINCTVIGTQPLCYCKGLKLVNCTMKDTDLSFEYSDVEADISGGIMSVKNPASGKITADSIGEVILENSVIDTDCVIECGKGK